MIENTILLAEIRRLRKAIYHLPYIIERLYETAEAIQVRDQLLRHTEGLIKDGPCGQCGKSVGENEGYGSVTGPVHTQCALGASGYTEWAREQEKKE